MQFIHDLFNHPLLRKLFVVLRYPLAILLLVLLALYARVEWFLPGLIVSFFGEVIQVWCFASLVKNEELTARGPYVMVRNPMYLGRFFLILGFLMLFGNIYVIVVYAVWYWFYMVNRVGREEARLQKLLGEPYASYCKGTPRFMPRLDRLFTPSVWFWDMKVMTNNNGHWNFLSAVAAWVVVAVYLFLIR